MLGPERHRLSPARAPWDASSSKRTNHRRCSAVCKTMPKLAWIAHRIKAVILNNRIEITMEHQRKAPKRWVWSSLRWSTASRSKMIANDRRVSLSRCRRCRAWTTRPQTHTHVKRCSMWRFMSAGLPNSVRSMDCIWMPLWKRRRETHPKRASIQIRSYSQALSQTIIWDSPR